MLSFSHEENQRPRRCPFCFEALWIELGECLDIIRETWRGRIEGSDLVFAMEKIKRCSVQLKEWNRTAFGFVKVRIQKVRDHLKMITKVDQIGLNLDKQDKARAEL